MQGMRLAATLVRQATNTNVVSITIPAITSDPRTQSLQPQAHIPRSLA